MAQVIMVGFVVNESGREQAHEIVMQQIGYNICVGCDNGSPHQIDSWWIAEDDRTDNSDNKSAVLVQKGRQFEADDILNSRDLT